MIDYKDRVVVITGAANGIGKELAKRFAQRGAKLALTDIDEKNLAGVKAELVARGTEVYIEDFDVSDYGAMDKFAGNVFKKFGSIDFFFNNAGVIAAGSTWDTPIKDWQWLYKVNVMGLVHGIKAFVPGMIKQDNECRIINTASIAGLATVENSPAYVATKFAAVSLTEVLELQLQEAKSKVKAYVVCPAIVVSDLNNCLRHRSADLYDADDPFYKCEDHSQRDAVGQMSMSLGLPTETAVTRILNGIEKDSFYILTHPEYSPLVGLRAQTILNGKRPAKIQR